MTIHDTLLGESKSQYEAAPLTEDEWAEIKALNKYTKLPHGSKGRREMILRMYELECKGEIYAAFKSEQSKDAVLGLIEIYKTPPPDNYEY